GGIIWITTAIAIVLLLRKRQQWPWIIGANLVSFFAFFIFLVTPTIFLIDEARQLPLRQISERVLQVQQPKEELLMIGFKKPSVVFYTQRPVKFFKVRKFFSDNSRELEYLNNSLTNKPSQSTLLIISRPKDMKKLGIPVQNDQIVEKKGRYQLMRLPKQTFLNDILKQRMNKRT
ncbi:MAG: glycosyltransferase, partial [Moorea sp. SIO2B7]|nr:glycosyltransferase [Moorena sp. SIO2B7]